MLFRQLFDCTSCTYTYLIANRAGQSAIIVDPVYDQLELYLELIQELELTLKITLDTHTHADHITASGLLHQQLGCDIAMSNQTHAQPIAMPLAHQQRVTFDDVSFTVLHTPGHTPDSCSLQFDDRVLTGDTLMIRRTGRTDFQHGDAHTQYHSLFEQLLTLPDDTLVYPAHDYRGVTNSTIGEERRYNPRLQAQSPQEYADIMDHLDLPKPKLIDIAVPANLSCGLEPPINRI